MQNLLKFSKANTKLNKGAKLIGKKLKSFTLPAGFTCPSAVDCLTKANEKTGKITDGILQKFRCYEASLEGLYPALREMAWYNLRTLMQNRKDMVNLIQDSLPKKVDVIRVHVGGDFMNQEYFDAWLQVAQNNPGILFYAYTKSIDFWIARLDSIPANFKLNASRGGKFDYLIDAFNLKEVVVVGTVEEAEKLGLELDDNDLHAYTQDKSFALLIHGKQPKGTKGKYRYEKLAA